FQGPFDGLARPVITEGAVRLPRDGDHAPVELRSKLPVYFKLGMTRGSALLQRRIVEKWKADRAFDLDRLVAREKNHRGVCIKAADLADAVNIGVLEESQNRVLQDRT